LVIIKFFKFVNSSEADLDQNVFMYYDWRASKLMPLRSIALDAIALVTKALQNWRIFVNSYGNDYAIMMITITEFPS